MKHSAISALRLAGILVGAAAWLHVAVGAAEDSPVQTRTMSGKAYEGEHLSSSDWPEPLYSVSLGIDKAPGIDRLRAINTDHRGRVFLTQTVDFDGDSPRAYTFSNSAAKHEGKLLVTPSELVMEFTEGGKTRTAKEPRPELFAVGPSISRIVEGHIGKIAAGRPIAFRMVAVNRLQTVGFRVARESSRADEPIPQVKSGQWLRLRAEPESAVARLFAPKILIIVDAKTGRTLSVSGPLPSPDPGVGMLKKGTIHYEFLDKGKP